MKNFFLKSIKKFINIFFKLVYGYSFDTYKAALSNRSIDSMSSVLLWMISFVKKKYPKFSLENKHVGEIGTGKFLSHPIGLIFLGANKVTTFDLFRQYNKKAAKLSYQQQFMTKKIFSAFTSSEKYSKLIEQIGNSGFELSKLSKFGINYLAPYDINLYNKENSFDFILSYTMLEHLPPKDIHKLLSKSINALKKGAHFCHFIDLEDHKDPKNNPFGFLINEEWSDLDCYVRGNRLRLNDWKIIFDKMDNIEYEFVSTLQRNKELLPKEVPNKINKHISGILVVGRKNI